MIEGFTRTDCTPITTDNVRHPVRWKGKPDCHLLQARPITLRFHLMQAKLYAFSPTIRHNHYLQSYDQEWTTTSASSHLGQTLV